MNEIVWLERHEPFIPSHWQPAVLVELMLHLGYNHHRVLRATGMFYDDMMSHAKPVAARQFLQLIENSQKLYPGKDLAFRFGQRLFPGHYGDYSNTLAGAANLYEGLQAICQLNAGLSPLLTPSFSLSDSEVELRWHLGFGPTAAGSFLHEAMCLAVKNYCQTRSQAALPWRFDFQHAPPSNEHDYEVSLSHTLRFNRPISRMRLPREYLYQTWSGGSNLIYERGMNAAQAEHNSPQRQPFIYTVREKIASQLSKHISQDSIAESLGTSVATLKRKCKQHNTSFQRVLDQVRLERAVSLYCEHGLDSEQVAKSLGYFDSANFRRSFRRWTGCTPKRYLRALRDN